MMFCKNCGNQLKPSASFCPSCGSQVGAPAPAPAQFPEQQPQPYTPDPAYNAEPAYNPDTYNPTPAYNPYPTYNTGPELPQKKPFYKRWWFWLITIILLLIIGFLALAGVGLRHAPTSDPAPGDHALVGTWEWDESNVYLLIFNNEGQGSRGFFPLIQRFDWEITEDGYINKTFRGGVVEPWDFVIRGNVLSIDQRDSDRAYSYIRRGEAPAPIESDETTQPPDNGETIPVPPITPGDASALLVGEWLWDRTERLYYTFRADGTGLRGFAQNNNFTWHVTSDGGLVINFGTRDGDWAFTIENDVLTIGRAGSASTFSYIRDGDAPPAADPPATQTPAPSGTHALVGIWSFDENPGWRYYFFPDGTGARGASDEFEWSVGTGNLLTITFSSAAANQTFGGLLEERWTYTITGGSLTLNSRQNTALSYSYTRVD